MKLTEKQKNCPYCHVKGAYHYTEPIENVPKHAMGLILRQDGWHIWTAGTGEFESAKTVNACLVCRRPLNEEEE